MSCGRKYEAGEHGSLRTASIFTLGCRLNQADSGRIADDLARHGFRIVPWGTPADLLVVNSCTVTAAAARKTRHTVRAARRRCPDAFVVLVGCDATVSPDSWSREPIVDMVVGNVAKEKLAEKLPKNLQRSRTPVLAPDEMAKRNDGFAEEGISLYPDRTRAHLKIQEGCDFRCSYCIVPTARGPARSRAWDDVLREADALLAEGYRELVLTGVNIATYRDKDRTLDSLCEALLQRNPSFRLRLSSTEPGPVLTDVVALMAENSRLCRFLHIPLQYGEDRILALMNRRYTVEQYSATVNAASEKIPGLCVGSDIIVGFPGETDEIFQACCKTVEVLPINHVHVFTYSKRAGTVAATLPHQVPGNFASERSSILKRICDRKADTFAASQIGRTLTVLTEERNSRGRWEGWSDNYLRVEIESTGEAGLGDNQLIPVLIDGMEDDRLLRGHAQNH